MKIFIDFEATEKREIISLGAYITDDNYNPQNTVYELIKPNFSEITGYIEGLTGLTNEYLATNGKTLDEAFQLLHQACSNYENDMSKWAFYCYGSYDNEYIKTSISHNLHSTIGWAMAGIISENLLDYSKIFRNKFKQQLGLMKIYNTLFEENHIQEHNSLKDAYYLFCVMREIEYRKSENKKLFDLIQTEKKVDVYTPPSGTLSIKKNGIWQAFPSSEDAITWVIKNNVSENDWPKVSRKKVMIKIMKATKHQSKAYNHQWKYEKGVV